MEYGSVPSREAFLSENRKQEDNKQQHNGINESVFTSQRSYFNDDVQSNNLQKSGRLSDAQASQFQSKKDQERDDDE